MTREEIAMQAINAQINLRIPVAVDANGRGRVVFEGVFLCATLTAFADSV